MKQTRRILNTLALTALVACSGQSIRAGDKVTLKVVKVDSEETAGENGAGANAVDGDPATFWHTQWQDDSPACPHEIVIELTPPARIKGFTYMARQDDSENGTIKDYEFSVSDDGKDFGTPVKKGALESGKDTKTITFDARQCRFIKLKALSEINDGAWASAAEIGVVLDTGTQPVATLKHRYSFATDASDSAGHANGTLQGAARVRDGQVQLDGTPGTYVNLPGGLIAGSSAVTFEFWASFGPNKNWARVFDQGSTSGDKGGHDLYFCPHSGAKDFRLTIMDPHPTERVVSIPGNLDNQTNQHVACVLDPATGFMGIYTNGVLAASGRGLTSLSSVDTNFFYLGKSLFATDAPLNGSINEFRIYGAALSAEAIAASYKNGPDAPIPAR
jgi:hypothetical protein